ncbi:MAG: phosphatase PAP2 family protein [Alphaproteobacteria bacterium]
MNDNGKALGKLFSNIDLIQIHHKRCWIILITCLFLSVLSIAFIDQPLHDYIQVNLPVKWGGFFAVITPIGLGGPWYILFGVAAIYGLASAFFTHSEIKRKQFRQIAKAAVYLLLVLVVTGLVVTILKIGIGRLRPSMLAEHGLSGFSPFNFAPGQGSFPSGHSQVIFAVMLGLHFVYPRYDFVYFFIAIIVAISRLMIGAHFLGDILIGAAIGGCGAFLIRNWFVARWGSVRLILNRDRFLAEI